VPEGLVKGLGELLQVTHRTFYPDLLELGNVGWAQLWIKEAFLLLPPFKELLFGPRAIPVQVAVTDPNYDMLRNNVRAKDVGSDLGVDHP